MDDEVETCTRRGEVCVPFCMKLAPRRPLDASRLSTEASDMELQKGMDDIAAGRTMAADAVDEHFRRRSAACRTQ